MFARYRLVELGIEKPLAERAATKTLRFNFQFDETEDFDVMLHQRVEASFSQAKRLAADTKKKKKKSKKKKTKKGDETSSEVRTAYAFPLR